MSPIAASAFAKRADADVKIAEATHVIPAQENTKRAKEETKREALRITAGIILAGMGMLLVYEVLLVAAKHLSGGDLALVLSAIVGVPGVYGSN